MRLPRRRWWALSAAALVLVLIATVAGLARAYPAVAAVACPRCYGMTRISGRLYVQRAATPAQRAALVAAVDAGYQRITAFYGSRRSAPEILACVTADCFGVAGREKGLAVLNRAVILSAPGITPVIAAHELSHVEFHQRLGGYRDRVPQWFDEGLAVLVSDDPRYLLPPGGADRCRVAPTGPLPASLPAWLHAAGTDTQVYAKAACRVSRWVAAHGGPPAVRDLIARVRQGQSFDQAIG